MKRILKIKYGSDKKHQFTYEDIKDAANEIIDEFTFSSKDKALPEFYEALQAMAFHAAEIMGFPESYRQALTALSISIDYAGDEEIMGAVITIRKDIETSNCPAIFNTPHKASAFAGVEDGQPGPQPPEYLLSADCVKAIEKLQLEAERYINGEREQLEMFKSNGKSEKAKIEATTPKDKGLDSSPAAQNDKDDEDDYQGEAFKAVESKKSKSKSEKAKRNEHTPSAYGRHPSGEGNNNIINLGG